MPFSPLLHCGLTVKVLPVLYGKDTLFSIRVASYIVPSPCRIPSGIWLCPGSYHLPPFAPAQPLGRSISIPVLYWRLLKCLHWCSRCYVLIELILSTSICWNVWGCVIRLSNHIQKYLNIFSCICIATL